MRRTGLYSSADRSRGNAGKDAVQAGGRSAGAPGQPVARGGGAGGPAGAIGGGSSASSGAPAAAQPASPRGLRARLRGLVARHERTALVLTGVVLALAVMSARDALRPAAQQLTQEDIDKAVLHTLETKPIPSRAAKAAEAVRQSIVRVHGYADEAPAERAGEAGKGGPAGRPGRGAAKGADAEDEPGAPAGRSTGSGVVIVDDGVILTNLHVVAGSKRIVVTFHDGTESEAVLVRAWPENDLAVLKAKKIPDDLPAATLGSTANLRPGDEVVAVGFPFGIGPSVSAGVVSGLNREFLSPKGKRVLTRLIQFDAAANPGNSGGPLVTMDGEVVGIVTAILSPNRAGTFIGIGFATTIEAAGGAVGIPPF